MNELLLYVEIIVTCDLSKYLIFFVLLVRNSQLCSLQRLAMVEYNLQTCDDQISL